MPISSEKLSSAIVNTVANERTPWKKKFEASILPSSPHLTEILSEIFTKLKDTIPNVKASPDFVGPSYEMNLGLNICLETWKTLESIKTNATDPEVKKAAAEIEEAIIKFNKSGVQTARTLDFNPASFYNYLYDVSLKHEQKAEVTPPAPPSTPPEPPPKVGTEKTTVPPEPVTKPVDVQTATAGPEAGPPSRPGWTEKKEPTAQSVASDKGEPDPRDALRAALTEYYKQTSGVRNFFTTWQSAKSVEACQKLAGIADDKRPLAEIKKEGIDLNKDIKDIIKNIGENSRLNGVLNNQGITKEAGYQEKKESSSTFKIEEPASQPKGEEKSGRTFKP